MKIIWVRPSQRCFPISCVVVWLWVCGCVVVWCGFGCVVAWLLLCGCGCVGVDRLCVCGDLTSCSCNVVLCDGRFSRQNSGRAIQTREVMPSKKYFPEKNTEETLSYTGQPHVDIYLKEMWKFKMHADSYIRAIFNFQTVSVSCCFFGD